MSQQDITPAVILDPGECLSVCGDLRGPLLTRLRNACSPVRIADLLANHPPERHQAVRDTLRDLEYFGVIALTSRDATALRASGKPYERTEKRERLDIVLPRRVEPEQAEKPAPKPRKTRQEGPRVPRAGSARIAMWDQVAAMRARGMLAREIGAALGVKASLILWWFHEAKASGWVDPKAAEACKAEARAIEMRREGKTIVQISTALGVPKTTVARWTAGV